MNDEVVSSATAPVVERVRHELRRRTLTVSEHSYLTPNMIRIKLTGDDLEGFTSLSADDHIKIFISAEEGEEPKKRDFTPRHYDEATQTLTLDFVAHDGGPATTWVQQAMVGDTLVVAGPRGSQVIRGELPRWLLIGDETALPAIGRRIEEMDAAASVISLVAVPSALDEQQLETEASLTSHWVHRDLHNATDAKGVINTLKDLSITADTFIWVAGETTMVKAVRDYLLIERGHPKAWLKAAGYWKQGLADAAEKIV